MCPEFDDEELLASLELTHYRVFKTRYSIPKDSTVEARNENPRPSFVSHMFGRQ